QSEFVKTAGDRAIILQRYARRLGRTLIGRNRAFQSMSKWNEPGGIDDFCAHWLGISDKDPDDRMEHAVVQLISEISDAAKQAENGFLEEQWKSKAEEIIDRYAKLFLGISPPQQEMISLS